MRVLNSIADLRLLDSPGRAKVRESVKRGSRPGSKPELTVVGSPGNTGSGLCKILRRLRYRHLSLLVALDAHRNLHRAARAVHLAQPSASKLVHDLELLFGASLFDRLPTGMQPTELGTVVLAFARRSLSELQRFADDLDNRRAGRNRRLVVGTTMDILPPFVVPAMAEIKQERPTLAITLIHASRHGIIKGLVEGRSDMAVGYFSGIPRDGDIDYEHLGSEALAIVARKNHPLSVEFNLSMQGLAGEAWVFHSLMGAAQAGMTAPANVIESNSVTTTLDLVLQSDALTILPESIVRPYVESGQLVRIPVAAGEIGFGVVQRREDSLNPAKVEFAELLRRAARRMGIQSEFICKSTRIP